MSNWQWEQNVLNWYISHSARYLLYGYLSGVMFCSVILQTVRGLPLTPSIMIKTGIGTLPELMLFHNLEKLLKKHFCLVSLWFFKVKNKRFSNVIKYYMNGYVQSCSLG